MALQTRTNVEKRRDAARGRGRYSDSRLPGT